MANAQLIEKRKKNQAVKAAVRQQMLRQIPKGGVAVEIGVWQGAFSRTGRAETPNIA